MKRLIELIKDIYKTEKAKRDEFRGVYITPSDIKVLGTRLKEGGRE